MSSCKQSKVLYLPDLTWPEVKDAMPGIKVAIIPVGSTEQHGPHGRFQTDYAAAREFSIRLGEELYPNTLVTTPVPIGISEHHIHFRGTLSLRATTLIDVLMDIATSLESMVLTDSSLLTATAETLPPLPLQPTGSSTKWDARQPGQHFLGSHRRSFQGLCPITYDRPLLRKEMSIMLYLWPDGVKQDALTPVKSEKNLDGLGRKLGIREAKFFDEVTENGALGDATRPA